MGVAISCAETPNRNEVQRKWEFLQLLPLHTKVTKIAVPTLTREAGFWDPSTQEEFALQPLYEAESQRPPASRRLARIGSG